MAGKKKDMKGGRTVLNSLFTRKKSNSNVEKNTYLNRIKKLGRIFTQINRSIITVNDLVINTKSLLTLLTQNNIKKYDEFTPLLKELKLILIQKLNEKLSTYYEIFKNPNSYNFSELLRLLEDFKILTDQINLLGGERNNLSSLEIIKNQFITAMLDKYEKKILSNINKNTNSQILDALNEEVLYHIEQYKQYLKEIKGKIGSNTSINSIVVRLSRLFDIISRLPKNNTGLQQHRLQQNSSQQPSQQSSQQLTKNKELKKKEFINYLSSINDELSINNINQIKIAGLTKAFNAITKEINSDSNTNSNINKLLTSIREKITALREKITALVSRPNNRHSNKPIDYIPNNNSNYKRNYKRILKGLEKKYPERLSDFGNLPTLATIASNIESIKIMGYGPERNSMIKKLQEKIGKFKNKLGEFQEFKEYEEFAYPKN
jgi:hypothetical protein